MTVFTFTIDGNNSEEFVTNWAKAEGWNDTMETKASDFIIQVLFANAHAKVRNLLLTQQIEVIKEDIKLQTETVTLDIAVQNLVEEVVK